MRDLSGDLFVTVEHIVKLLGKSISTARNVLREIRRQFGVVKPQLVTRDHVCIFYKITVEQYIARVRG